MFTEGMAVLAWGIVQRKRLVAIKWEQGPVGENRKILETNLIRFENADRYLRGNRESAGHV